MVESFNYLHASAWFNVPIRSNELLEHNNRDSF